MTISSPRQNVTRGGWGRVFRPHPISLERKWRVFGCLKHQERYTGNILLQKTYVENHITQKSKINRGELPMYYAENTHPAIIDLETFEKVQAEIARRREMGVFANWSINTTCFTSKIKCGNCGVSYRRSGKRQQTDSNQVYYIWTCQTKDRNSVSACNAKNVPEKMLQKVCAQVLGLGEFDEGLLLEQIDKIVVNGQDKLIFHFYDGRVITQHWESTARKDWWTPQARAAKSVYSKKNPRSSGTITCFTGKIYCGKCGQNLRRNTSTRVSGEKTHHWRCPPRNDCAHNGLEENLLKTISADVLGINEFDEAVFVDKVDRITVVSNEQLIFHLKDGSDVAHQWQFKRRQPAWSEERKQRHSKKMLEVWRDKHEQRENS
ncbi:recombinase zinc beta ribbon domain-containing protein [Syntrophomonas wolfei]|uniref:recombinase zinc beta ribbon domain-containing protein n=1 Tax=Syntrophomonas wolfei TaxID=863 RepID=UPI0009EC0D07|nr:recombinase zinc beta ribbon domain-containing protein [Syntrophomonas wolfei]